ncbi:PAS domain-containing sensor histidine kinase [Pelagerythrobacter sp.]|uniref:sensor histidine kinase n=1 Tax=Pelagerythrobacter sp. TaxID=2800702 RepID=UPI0035B0CDBB
MTSSPRAPALAFLALLAGAAAAAAWAAGLPAAGLVALMVGAWAVAASLQGARRFAGHARATGDRPRPEPDRAALTSHLDASPLPLLLLDSDENLIALNRAARRFFAAEHRILVPPDGLVETIRATAPGQGARFDIHASGATGDARAFALATSDVAGPFGSGRIAALSDIGAELRAAEAATLRDLVRVLGHEIANTLTPIASLGRTAAEIVNDPQPDMIALREAVDTIARRAEGLQRFGEAYRELSRLPPPCIEKFDAAIFLGDLAALFRTTWPTIDLTCDFDRAPGTLRADRDQLHVALWAVLQNAAEAANETAPAARFACIAERGTTIFQIMDNGAGVAPELLVEIFQPFVTYKREGTGIGLTLARQILRAHRGDIQVHTDDHMGANFRIILP